MDNLGSNELWFAASRFCASGAQATQMLGTPHLELVPTDSRTMSQPAAGWYPSPTNPNAQQYWDGSTWTEHFQPNAPSGNVLAPIPPTAAAEKRPLWKRKIMWPVYGVFGIAALGVAAGDQETDPASREAPPSAEAVVTPAQASEEGGTSEAAEDPIAMEDVPAEVALATRENPQPMGEPIEVTLEALGDADGSVWTLRVIGAAEDVTADAVSEGFASDPIEGNIIVGVPFELTLMAAGKEPLAPIFNLDVELFSPTTATIAESTLGCGFWDLAFDSNTEVFIGGTSSGLLCAEVAASDLGNGLFVTADEEGDRVFLATN